MQTYYKKRLLALVLVYRNLVNFIIAQNKKAVNALWDMDYPAAERPYVDCSVWWLFIFGVGVACLFLRKGIPEPL